MSSTVRSRGLSGWKRAAVGAVALAAAAMASTTASAATYVKLLSSSMNTQFQAYIQGVGNVYSNGMAFQVKDSDALGNVTGPAYELFGFCVDIYHSISIGSLNLVYSSNQDPLIVNPLPTDFGGNPISPTQLSALTDLIDTGYIMRQQALLNGPLTFDMHMRLAAIQAAIWKTEVPSRNIYVTQGGLTGSQFATYQGYFNDYFNGNYTSLADANDRFYVISNPNRQSFGIGWPIHGVPEPGTWALMLIGFFGAGSAIRRRQAAEAA